MRHHAHILSMTLLLCGLGCSMREPVVPEEDAATEGPDSTLPEADALIVDQDATTFEDAHELDDAGEPDAFACGPRYPTPCPDASIPDVDAGTDAGNDAGRPDAFLTPDAGPPPDRTTIIQFALGTEHTCLLRASGVVRCWGNPGSSSGFIPGTPSLLDATEIAAVGNMTYARRRDGTVVSWLGVEGPLSPASMPPEPPALMEQFSCIGETFPFDRTPYVEVYGRIIATRQTACGRRVNGSVFCWGTNYRGEIGRDTGMFTYDLRCGEVLLDGARMDAIAIGRGPEHACAALRDGRVVCWGSNNAGQLGTWVPGLQTFEPVEPYSFFY